MITQVTQITHEFWLQFIYFFSCHLSCQSSITGHTHVMTTLISHCGTDKLEARQLCSMSKAALRSVLPFVDFHWWRVAGCGDYRRSRGDHSLKLIEASCWLIVARVESWPRGGHGLRQVASHQTCELKSTCGHEEVGELACCVHDDDITQNPVFFASSKKTRFRVLNFRIQCIT